MGNWTMRGYNFHWYSFQCTLKEKGYKRLWKTACDFSQTSGKILLFWLFPETALIFTPRYIILCNCAQLPALSCCIITRDNAGSSITGMGFPIGSAKGLLHAWKTASLPQGWCPLPAAVASAPQCTQWCHKVHGGGSYYFCWYCDPTTYFSSAKFPFLKTALPLK